MIDWISASIPYTHDQTISDGSVISLDSNGEIDWQTSKRLPVRGSHEININVKTDRSSYDPELGKFTRLHIDGNPTKWIQGHNLFGTDDVKGLVIETAKKLYSLLNITPSPNDLVLLYSGQVPLHRVDINYSFDLKNKLKVISFIKAMESQAHMKHRGAGIMKGKTLYFGQHSRRWSLKMYSKGDEISSRKKGHQLNPALSLLGSLKTWADSKLRIELTLRSLQLKDSNLASASIWEENTPLETFKMYLEPLNMSNQTDLTSDALLELPLRLKAVYALWKTGEDLRTFYPKNTFYRHRRAMLEFDIDISVVQPSTTQSTANVVPFIQIIEDVTLATVPSWAVGTDLYFEPKFYA